MASLHERSSKLQQITIGRFQDSDAQGVIRPEDDSWQLVIDADGYPHLYVRVKLASVAGEPTTGMFCVEDMLPPEMNIRELMSGGEFGGELAPEEEDAAHAAYLAERELSRIPCPRP